MKNRNTLKKLCSVLLSAATVFGVAACGGEKAPSAKNPDTVATEHYQTGTLHKVNVTESTRTFVKNGVSDYKILYPDGDLDARKAASLVSKHVGLCTGFNIPVVANDDIETIAQTDKYIIFGRRDLFTAAGLTMPADDIGNAGYYMKSYGDSVFIQVKTLYGYQQAAITFLDHVLGWEMYSEDTVVYEKTGETLPDMDIIESPDFDYRVQGNNVSVDTRYSMGFINNQDIIIPVQAEGSSHNGIFHNDLNYFDAIVTSDNSVTLNQEMLDAHPEWFSTGMKELCYTARGDSYGTLDDMVEHVAQRIVKEAGVHPDKNVITFTIQDNYDTCACQWCEELKTTYGTPAAGNIRFTNMVADRVEEIFTAEAEANGTEKRELLITIFAYHMTNDPPVTKDSNGDIVPIDESVVCRDNVGVFVAPITASWTHSFYDEVNASYAEMVKGWGTLSKHIYAWLYEPNYNHYLYPLNTFDSMQETMRFMVENNAEYVWTEGQSLQSNPPSFNKFKEYLNSKAEFDVNVNYDDLVENFFDNYFGEARDPMYQFFVEMQMWCRKIEDEESVINGGIYEEIANVAYWPKKTLDHWMDLIDEAYAAIEPLKYSDIERYEVLARHIKNESIFPRFALITLHTASYSPNELLEERLSFKADCEELSIMYRSQNGKLDMLYTEWGI